MKKIALLFLMLCLCFGCQSQNNNSQLDIYQQIVDHLQQKQEFDSSYPCQIEVIFNPIEDYFRYDVIIHQATKDMYNIKAVAYVDNSLDESYPSLGVFDEEEYHLKVDYVDKTHNYYKGVQLSGTCQKEETVKLYLSYYADEQKTKQIEKYIEVNK
ncbi:MAG: hypothetical protein ACLUVC_08355 [Longibaculum sp.]